MRIREEKQSDFDEIYNFTKLAFETAEVSDGDEQDFVEQLRKSDNYVPSLALVTEKDNTIIGHIMLTKFKTNGVKSLLLAPVTVMLEYRNQKVGTMLIEEGIRRAIEQDYEAIFLVGHPAYYPRFGFIPTMKYGINNINGIPEEVCMVLELKKGILNDVDIKLDFQRL